MVKDIVIIFIAFWLFVGHFNFWYMHWWHADSLDYIAGLVCLIGVLIVSFHIKECD